MSTGVLGPDFSPYLEPLITPLVIFLVYSSLRGARLDEIEFTSYAFLVLLSVFVAYVVVPTGGIHVAEAFLTDGAVVGFAIALSVPTTAGSAIIWTRFSRGDVQLATTISLVSLLAAPIATPIILTHLIDTQSAVSAGSVLADLALIIVGGGLLALMIPSNAVSVRTVDAGAMLAILLLIYTSVARIEFFETVGRAVLVIVGVSVLLLGFGLIMEITRLKPRPSGRGYSRQLLPNPPSRARQDIPRPQSLLLK
ncbi:bile acid:sodium symporter [Halegenticoccus tardaugens]|uniref:bile acid:sodium symporter n=1 Tax=Halegenticoccus tardaugens TaxID=2071624 RepID=UPI0013E92676|nr:bile acid:sodium symporter [Halegenticoccus tardaugens]